MSPEIERLAEQLKDNPVAEEALRLASRSIEEFGNLVSHIVEIHRLSPALADSFVGQIESACARYRAYAAREN